LPKWLGFSQLLGNPSIGGMAGHRDVDDFSALQFDDEEAKERTEEEIRHRQEVAGPDLVCMILYEGGPGLRGGPHAWLTHVLLDRAFRGLNAQFEQLPADALGTSQAIVQRHRLDQRDGLSSDFEVPRGWTLHLTAKHDQLLTQQGVFGDELGLGASEVGERPGQKGSTPRAHPAQYIVLDPTE
jgi:hypothetical protein